MSVSLLLALGVATQSATAEQLTPGRLPFASFLHFVEGLFDDVSASLPGETDGRDAGAHGTKAGRGSGHAPGVGKAQLAAAGDGAPQAGKAGLSGSITRGFDARTSVLDQSRTSPYQTWYKNSDGSLTEHVSQAPVNFKDSSGHWRLIDNSLALGGSGRSYTVKANSFGLSLAVASGAGSGVTGQSTGVLRAQDVLASPSPSGSASPSTSASASPSAASSSAPAGGSASLGSSSTGLLASLTLPSSEEFGWSLAGAGDVGGVESADGMTLTYPGILPETNLSLTSETYGVKESLTLASASAGNVWQFPLSLKGLSIGQGADGSWQLTDGSGGVVATVEAPYAWSRHGLCHHLVLCSY